MLSVVYSNMYINNKFQAGIKILFSEVVDHINLEVITENKIYTLKKFQASQTHGTVDMVVTDEQGNEYVGNHSCILGIEGTTPLKYAASQGIDNEGRDNTIGRKGRPRKEVEEEIPEEIVSSFQSK